MSEVHICRGTGTFFMARCRRYGARKWSWLGPKRNTEIRALHDMVREWNSAAVNYIEADVMMAADYYEPLTLAALRRK